MQLIGRKKKNKNGCLVNLTATDIIQSRLLVYLRWLVCINWVSDFLDLFSSRHMLHVLRLKTYFDFKSNSWKRLKMQFWNLFYSYPNWMEVFFFLNFRLICLKFLRINDDFGRLGSIPSDLLFIEFLLEFFENANHN